MTFMNHCRAFVRDRRGANMVEYIILVGIVALFAIGAFKMFGGKVVDRVKAQGTTVGNINGNEGPQ
jgi:pilus assembly protein Flp/PilA